MKTILVDAVDGLMIETPNGFEVYDEMQTLLDTFPNRKIIVTNAAYDIFPKYCLDKAPYEVFTLEHKPDKPDPVYFRTLLKHFELDAADVMYFEHNPDAVASAASVGITSYFWNNDTRPLEDLRNFLTNNL